MTHTKLRLSVLFCTLTLLVATCNGDNPGRDPCEGRQCGTFEGKDCGACPGATEECSDTGLCEDRCAGRQCGPVEGGTCGTCPGTNEVCDDETGQCVDVCADRECGEPVPGISCGLCTVPERCGLPGRCFEPGGCPAGMIEVGLTGVCIDAHEVTCNQMTEFLNAHGSNECRIDGFRDWNERYECYSGGAGYGVVESNGLWQVQPGFEHYPTVWVTYVGARLACEHWGKRLCTIEEWAEACEGPEVYVYPYGNTYEPYTCNACNDSQTQNCPTEEPTPVGSFPGCEGGYSGLYDMSGNVAEWAMDYEFTPLGGIYTAMGGYFGYGGDVTTCRFLNSTANSPYAAFPQFGFRCCFHLD